MIQSMSQLGRKQYDPYSLSGKICRFEGVAAVRHTFECHDSVIDIDGTRSL